MSEESEQAARNNAARKRDDDLAYLSTYISTDAGAEGNSNADVLGRLLIDAHARLDNLDVVLDRIGASLEHVVAPKLHELRTLPERITALEARRAVDTGDDACTACGHPAESHGGLGSVCLIGSCDCMGYTYTPPDNRDREREAELFTRTCPSCGSTLVLESVYPDTKRPERLACSERVDCATLWRVDYESDEWLLVPL